jgi:hypothetical protein
VWASGRASTRVPGRDQHVPQAHLLQLELLHARLIRGDRRALDAHVVLLDGLGRLDRHPVVGRVAVGQAQVEVLDLEVEVGEDELVLDHLPDDAVFWFVLLGVFFFEGWGRSF